MRVNVEKYQIPIIWLDTYVIINMAKSIIDGSFNEEEKVKYVSLFELLQNKVHEEKIICPKGDQHEEIEQGQRLERECHEIQNRLSFGVSFIHRSEIEANQRRQMMKAYIEGKDQVVICCVDVFENDPIETVRMAKSSGYIVSAFMKTRTKQIEMEAETKIKTREMLENLRRSSIQNNISFEEQLEDEYQSIVQAGIWAINNCLSKMQNRIPLTFEDNCQLQIILEPLEEWRLNNGQPEDLPGLLGFINSEHYKKMPYIDIHAKLAAIIVTSNSKIKAGDAMDVNQLSTVIPYSNYVVTDKKMKKRLIELGIDKKYGTNIYYIGDSEELINILDAL